MRFVPGSLGKFQVTWDGQRGIMEATLNGGARRRRVQEGGEEARAPDVTTTVLLTITGPDRTGLVAEVAGRLFELGANLGDTTFAVLGEACELTALVELPAGLLADELDHELESLASIKGAKLAVEPFALASVHGPKGRVTHRIRVSGGDRPGIIARLAEAFADFGANIVRLNSERVPGSGGARYDTIIAVAIPKERAAACLATVANTAGAMDLQCAWEEA